MKIIEPAVAALMFALLALASGAANAGVILDIDGSGELLGARNVLVAGTLFDLRFVDGTCIAVFDGCDSVTDFDFQTVSDASAAAQAILDQVIDGTPFDSNPALVHGVDGSSHLMIPFAFSSQSSALVLFRSAFNSNGTDVVGNGTFFRINDTTGVSGNVWVDFERSRVSEPGTLLLFAAGLVGIFARRRRDRNQT